MRCVTFSKYLISFVILSTFHLTSTVFADVKNQEPRPKTSPVVRPAPQGGTHGGGGDFRGLLKDSAMDAPVSADFAVEAVVANYQQSFCEKGRQGLRKLGLLLDADPSLAAVSVAEVERAKLALAQICENGSRLFRLDQHLKIENAEETVLSTAQNWPATGEIALNPREWEMISKLFEPALAEALRQAIAAHEALSLVGAESTGKYDASRILVLKRSVTPEAKSIRDYEPRSLAGWDEFWEQQARTRIEDFNKLQRSLEAQIDGVYGDTLRSYQKDLGSYRRDYEALLHQLTEPHLDRKVTR